MPFHRASACRSGFVYSSPAVLKLVSPDLPITTWSCTEIPSFSPAATISRVISMSAFEGVGSPDGWCAPYDARFAHLLLFTFTLHIILEIRGDSNVRLRCEYQLLRFLLVTYW